MSAQKVPEVQKLFIDLPCEGGTPVDVIMNGVPIRVIFGIGPNGELEYTMPDTKAVDASSVAQAPVKTAPAQAVDASSDAVAVDASSVAPAPVKTAPAKIVPEGDVRPVTPSTNRGTEVELCQSETDGRVGKITKNGEKKYTVELANGKTCTFRHGEDSPCWIRAPKPVSASSSKLEPFLGFNIKDSCW